MTEIEKKYRTGTKRLLAGIIDAIVISVPLLFLDDYFRTEQLNKSLLFLWLIIYAFIPMVYSVYLHFKYGQTLGKLITGIKVLNLDEKTNLSFFQSMLRDSFYIVLEIIDLFYCGFQLIFSNEPTSKILAFYDDIGALIAVIWILIELITMLLNNKMRAIHDFMANSVVIRTESKREEKTYC